MDLADLAAVKAVAELGGATPAAERLNCVPSAVTARLKRLEAELNVALFRRRSRGLDLTEAGQRLKDYADRLLMLAEEARRSVAGGGMAGLPVRIGAMETIAATRLPGILGRFRQQAGGEARPIGLATGTTDELVADLLRHRLDVALIAGPLDHPALASRRVWTEHLVQAAPVAGAETGSDGLPLPLIGFRSGCAYRARAEKLLREAGRLPVRVLELGTLDGVIGCVAAGLGFTILPARVFQGHTAPGIALTPLPAAAAEVEVLAAWPRGRGDGLAEAFAAAAEAA